MNGEREFRIAIDGLANHAQRSANAVARLRIEALHEPVRPIQLQILPIFAVWAQLAVFDAFHVFLTVGIYAVDPARRADSDAIEAAAKRHAGVKAVHGVFFDDERGSISFDVLLDFTVRDRDALRSAILAEIEERFPGRAITINFDTDYSD